MSLNSLANEAATKALAKPSEEALVRSLAATAASQDDALAALTKYIPTESITLYVATLSAQKALSTFLPWLTPTFAYIAFVVITPILMLILFFRKFAVEGKSLYVPCEKWPWWRMSASTIAFAAWALAVPGNPVITASSETGGVVAAFASMLVSSLLNLFTPFFETAKTV